MKEKLKWNDNKWWIYVKVVACLWIAVGVFMIGYTIEDLIHGKTLLRKDIIATIVRFIQVLTGAGILARLVWARYSGMIFAILTTFIFPIGTPIGILMIIGIIKTKESFGRPVNQTLDSSAG